MQKNRVVTVLGVLVAVVIAWFLVDIFFRLAWFIGKLVVVAIVAVVVWLVLRMLLSRPSDE